MDDTCDPWLVLGARSSGEPPINSQDMALLLLGQNAQLIIWLGRGTGVDVIQKGHGLG